MTLEIMRPDLVGPMTAATAGCGVALQYACRQWSKIEDTFTVTLGVIVGLGLWALAVNWAVFHADPQAFLLGSIPAAIGCVSSLFGGMYSTSHVANAAVQAKPRLADNVFVPATNSK